MCGRYASYLPPEAIARLFGTVNPLPDTVPTWNLAPGQDALVVRRHPETGARHLDLLRWGLVPHFTKDLAHARRPINARAESVATSGIFRGAFASRRCLVPAMAFYEWKRVTGGKQPYAVARADGQPMAFAGLWEGPELTKRPPGTHKRTKRELMRRGYRFPGAAAGGAIRRGWTERLRRERGEEGMVR